MKIDLCKKEGKNIKFALGFVHDLFGESGEQARKRALEIGSVSSSTRVKGK